MSRLTVVSADVIRGNVPIAQGAAPVRASIGRYPDKGKGGAYHNEPALVWG
jgi:hypothetical protein